MMGVYPPTSLWTSQHRPKASAIRRTTGLGSGSMLSANGWVRVTKEEMAQPRKGLGHNGVIGLTCLICDLYTEQKVGADT